MARLVFVSESLHLQQAFKKSFKVRIEKKKKSNLFPTVFQVPRTRPRPGVVLVLSMYLLNA